MTVQEKAHQMKLASAALAATDHSQRCSALAAVKEMLLDHQAEIFAENARDLSNAQKDQVPVQVIKRLRFDEKKLADVCAGIDQLMDLPDPLGRVTLHRELDEDLVLTRLSVPIGVIGVIFEARPDALVQISALCIKSGNCVILKGGKETACTNRILSRLIADGLCAANMPEGCFDQVEERSQVDALLACDGDIDLIIPRGSNAFVRYIMDHTRIPVMGHADGVCHLFVDQTADVKDACRVIVDAKTQYPVACNAVETVLVHEGIAPTFLPILYETLRGAGVRMKGTPQVAKLIPCEALTDGFHHEYGDLILTLSIVKDCADAVDHINRYGSHHTDGILTRDEKTAAYFRRMVDSAGVYVNCSTRFADGFRYGFGAEVGISTGKLHARGPVGLEGLVTYKYCLEGKGHIVGDYAGGLRSFRFRDRNIQP